MGRRTSCPAMQAISVPNSCCSSSTTVPLPFPPHCRWEDNLVCCSWTCPLSHTDTWQHAQEGKEDRGHRHQPQRQARYWGVTQGATRRLTDVDKFQLALFKLVVSFAPNIWECFDCKVEGEISYFDPSQYAEALGDGTFVKRSAGVWREEILSRNWWKKLPAKINQVKAPPDHPRYSLGSR